MRPPSLLLALLLSSVISSLSAQNDWNLLIDGSNIPYSLSNDESLFDQSNQRIYFRNTDAGFLGYVDLTTNLIVTLPSSGWFGRMDEMVLDTANATLYGWRAGKSTVYSIPATGGTWTAVSPSSSDASHFHGACYWNPINQGVGFFGGYGFFSMKNTIHEIPGMSGGWIQTRGNTNTGNPPRSWCNMSSNENGEEIYIYGTHGNINGSQYQYPLSIVDGSNYNWARGLWKLNLNDYSIETIIPLDDPSVLQYTDIAFDYNTNRIFVSGGRLLTPTATNTNQGAITNITQFYDLNNPTGFELLQVGDSYPAEGGSLWYDGDNNRLLHAGTSGLWSISLSPAGPIPGCTDAQACNYDPAATDDDASCIAPSCDDPTACNYDADANCGGGTCIPSGCMDSEACNYNPAAQCAGEACDYSCCPGPGCCGPGTTWDPQLQTCIAETPSPETAENCTLFNLQGLSIGYLQLAEQNAAQDTLIITQQAAIDSLNALLNNCPGND